jgi:hypothetical protein
LRDVNGGTSNGAVENLLERLETGWLPTNDPRERLYEVGDPSTIRRNA